MVGCSLFAVQFIGAEVVAAIEVEIPSLKNILDKRYARARRYRSALDSR